MEVENCDSNDESAISLMQRKKRNISHPGRAMWMLFASSIQSKLHFLEDYPGAGGERVDAGGHVLGEARRLNVKMVFID